jgi:hypothetical protein
MGNMAHITEIAAAAVMWLCVAVSAIGLVFWAPSMWKIPEQYKRLKRKK